MAATEGFAVEMRRSRGNQASSPLAVPVSGAVAAAGVGAEIESAAVGLIVVAAAAGIAAVGSSAVTTGACQDQKGRC